MPPPIVPAPIIPTLLISNNSVSFGISGILATCLWAKKKYLCAADWLPLISLMNKSLSTLMPSSKGLFTAASIHWILYSGAKNPLVFLSIDFLKFWKSSSLPLAAFTFSSRSLTFFSGLFSSIISFAKDIDSFKRSSLLANLSIRPFWRHCSAGRCRPEVTIFRACSTPTNLGSLCVPPAPGNKPRFTSGKPHFADLTAIL